ncbi:unnamed protein product, partial [Sphagnum jensenii]
VSTQETVYSSSDGPIDNDDGLPLHQVNAHRYFSRNRYTCRDSGVELSGLSANEVEKRVTFLGERAYSTTVNAIAQISAVSGTALRSMPPGITPPTILQYNASNVPVTQLTLSSKTMSEDKIFDYGLNFIRLRLFTIPGLATPAPFGGKFPQMMIDIDPKAMTGKGCFGG